ncbi:MAG: histidinol dehydrogenase [Actinobacteria bacterium]|nr:histidinol dehydrogenase [Actinomycetota bacterium]
MRVFDSNEYDDTETLRQALGWDFWMEEGPVDEVRAIIAQVRGGGDDALLDLTRRFDGVDLTARGLRVASADLSRCAETLGRDFTNAIKAAAKSITSFHRHQSWESQFWDSSEGARVGQMTKPLDRVGVYIPGGNASYPSTALMTVIPARVAGVSEIAVCVPPSQSGEISPHTLFALQTLEIEEIYRVGGAQAVAALALGTETIRAVDKIVGPGNIYVTLAKREVVGRVGIDMLAGPSELVVLADETADAEFLILEIMAQMEHGAGARACLIATDGELIRQVGEGLARDKIPGGGAQPQAVLIENMDEGARLVNELAPEHLFIATEDVTDILPKIRNAGAVFLGTDSPVALGDYAVGVNHVLPTKGAARFSSPLGVYDFVKMSNIVLSNPKANRTLGPVVEAIAKVEGLLNHAEAMHRRYH